MKKFNEKFNVLLFGTVPCEFCGIFIDVHEVWLCAVNDLYCMSEL